MSFNLKSIIIASSVGFAAMLTACQSSNKKLPIMGERTWEEKVVDGKTITDTIYHQIPSFTFVNQYSDTITEKNVANKIYVTDFFFTSCPTICQVMKKNMLKVYSAIKGQEDVMILSHTIDPRNDVPEVLKQFAEDMGVTGTQWMFLTGPKEKVFEIGQGSYMVAAQEDSTVQGGILHSGAFVLVDKDRHVRGMYDGTDEAKVKDLIRDIEILRKEYAQN